jgi:CspA family cold shock protein
MLRLLQSHIDGFRRFAAPYSFFPCSRSTGRAGSRFAPNEGIIHMAITGTVKFFNADKGYGFIAPDGGGNDAFVHITAVERAGMRTLDKDQRVQYDLEEDRRGKMSAVNLQPAE